MKYILFLLLMISLPASALSELQANKVLNKMYSAVSPVLWDKTRPDMVTDTHAYEIDWTKKWAEGCSQAFYYGKVTRKIPVLILLVTDKNSLTEIKHIYRAQSVCFSIGVGVILEDANILQNKWNAGDY